MQIPKATVMLTVTLWFQPASACHDSQGLCIPRLLPVITFIVNSSIVHCVVPEEFKTAMVKPIPIGKSLLMVLVIITRLQICHTAENSRRGRCRTIKLSHGPARAKRTLLISFSKISRHRNYIIITTD